MYCMQFSNLIKKSFKTNFTFFQQKSIRNIKKQDKFNTYIFLKNILNK